MSSSTTKKVVVRRFDRENLTGFINPLSYLQPNAIELLKPDGTPYRQHEADLLRELTGRGTAAVPDKSTAQVKQ